MSDKLVSVVMQTKEMEEAVAATYWCHVCSRMVNPKMEVEIKCPSCQSGFLEEMGSDIRDNQDTLPDLGSDRALSLWAPILLGMMGGGRLRRRSSGRQDLEEEGEDDDGEGSRGDESELDRQLESIIRRRRRSPSAILQLLRSVQAGMTSEIESSEGDGNNEGVILINPFNQTIIVQGSYDSNQSQSQNQGSVGSVGDHFIGSGLDLLLQHLAENDPNGYGTPPARKDAVEAMPSVTVTEENLQCSVCLDDFEMGVEVREMPCKHKYHRECILPWLELHSSCPVCRFQMPAVESKAGWEGSQNSSNRRGSSGGEEGDGRHENGGRRFSIPWPFNGLFSSSASQTGGSGDSSSTSSTSSSFLRNDS